MTTHLSDDALLEMAETGKSHPHLAACDRCRRMFEDARDALTLACAENVPEPSPLFWDRFSARVREAVENEPGPPRRFTHAQFPVLGRGPALAMTLVAIVVAIVVWRAGQGGGPVGQPATSTYAKPSGSAAPGPAAADARMDADMLLPVSDPSLSVLAQVTAHIRISDVADSGIVLEPDAVDRAISQLSPSEQQELIRLLQAVPEGPSW